LVAVFSSDHGHLPIVFVSTHLLTIMPVDRSIITSTHYNIHSHDNHRDNDQPYLLPRTVYIQSSTHDPTTSFQHLCLNDNIIAAKRVTHHKLEHLETSRYLRGLIVEGAKESWDADCPFNGVLQTSIGYASACTAGVLDDIATVNDKFISFREQASRRLDVADVEIEDLKRDLRVARDMRMTTAERLIGLSETVTDLSGSVGLLSIEMDPLHRLPQAMEQLILLSQINNICLSRSEDCVEPLERRVAELLVAVCHGVNNPIVLDEEDEIRAGSPMPLMVRVEQEDTVVPPSRSPSPL
jgi:hypothetical protein